MEDAELGLNYALYSRHLSKEPGVVEAVVNTKSVIKYFTFTFSFLCDYTHRRNL